MELQPPQWNDQKLLVTVAVPQIGGQKSLITLSSPPNLSSDVITFSKLSSNELFPFFKSESRRRFGPYRLFELV